MKLHKIIYILITFTGVFSIANAQQKIDPLLEVSRDFDGKLLEIHKSKLNTSINDSLTQFNLDFNYSIFKKPYRDMYEFNPIPSLQIEQNIYPQPTKFYIKASAGYPFNPKGTIYYMPIIDKRAQTKNTLIFWGDIDAFIGEKKLYYYNAENLEYYKTGDKAKANYSQWNIGTQYNHYSKNNHFYSQVDYIGNKDHFYGNNTFRSAPLIDDKVSNTIKFNTGTQSINTSNSSTKFNYKLDFEYLRSGYKLNSKISNYTDNGVTTEDLINIKGAIGPNIGKYNKILVGFTSNTVINKNEINNHTLGLFTLTPKYKFQNKNFELNIGVNLSFLYGNQRSSKIYHNFISPDIYFSMRLLKETLWFYASAEGDNYINSNYSISNTIRYFKPSTYPIISSTPILLKVGIKGKTSDKFSFELFGGYNRNSGMLQFSPMSFGSYYEILQSTHNGLFAELNLLLKTKDIIGGLNIRTNSYSKGTHASSPNMNGHLPTGYARFEGTFYTEYNYMERLFATLNVKFRSKSAQNYMESNIGTSVYSYNPSLKGYANVSLQLKYKISSSIIAFVACNNILNQDIQYYPFYSELGINFNTGLILKF